MALKFLGNVIEIFQRVAGLPSSTPARPLSRGRGMQDGVA